MLYMSKESRQFILSKHLSRHEKLLKEVTTIDIAELIVMSASCDKEDIEEDNLGEELARHAQIVETAALAKLDELREELMPVTAHSFCIVDLGIGMGCNLGGSVVCPKLGYISRRLRTGADRLERRFVPVAAWLEIEKELQALDSRPVDADSVLSRTILGEPGTHSLALQRLSEMRIEGGPAKTGGTLDALLQSLLPPILSLQQQAER